MKILFNEAEALKLNEQGLSDRKIGQLLNVHHNKIARWRKAKGIESIYHNRKSTDEELIPLYMNGLNDNQIGEELGCSTEYVKKWREARDLKSNLKIFDWQLKLKPSEFKKIPEKYRRMA